MAIEPIDERQTTTEQPAPAAALYRLLAWLSPSFPIGAFSYSHGLEAAVEAGMVCDRDTLRQWVAALISCGSGRIDADLLRDAHRAAEAGDIGHVAVLNRRGIAFRATAELALESAQQGAAFRLACSAAWPDDFVRSWAALDRPNAVSGAAGEAARRESGVENVCHAVAFGVAAARAGIALPDALIGYLQAFAANLIAAGLRLGIVGQTDGQRILCALEPVVIAAAADAATRVPADFGSATFAADLAAMMHETQYSRLFRS